MQNLLNWKIYQGVLVSILSFLGMFTLLWVFPSKSEKSSNNIYKQSQEISANSGFEAHKSSPISTKSNFGLKSEDFKLKQLDESPITFNFSKVSSSFQDVLPNNRFNITLLPYFVFRNMLTDNDYFSSNQKNGYFLQMSYNISPHLVTELNVTHSPLLIQFNREYTSINTGVQLKLNPYFSTSLFAGGTLFYRNRFQNQNLFLLENITPFEKKNNFELKTEIRIIKNLFLQTSIYNVDQLFDEVNSSQGTKFVFGYGLDFLQLSLRYNYMGTQIFRNGRVFENNLQNRDAGGFEIMIFLDKNKNFSLYLGNNYFNLFSSPRYEDRTNPLPYTTSYSASLRGKALQKGFLFLNFRNQISKDLQYFNFGHLPIPFQNTQQENSTTLGLELWF